VSDSIRCRLCAGEARFLFAKPLLVRHRARYYQCGACGLTQTQPPDWLDEAYADAIHPTDTGLLSRNQYARRIVAVFLHLAGAGARPCLDWAGGYGVFTRLMRDCGFAFYTLDPHAENLFAKGFAWNSDRGTPFACTAFEVLEHLVRPSEGFAELAAYGAEFIVTGTQLHAGAAPVPDWPYLSPESGQHVAFYRPETLARLGRDHGYPYLVAGPYFQVFARRSFPAWHWRLATLRGAPLYALVRRLRRGLTEDDCEMLRRERRS
jgi:hypothetical protein